VKGVDEIRPDPDGLSALSRNPDQRLFWNFELNRRLLTLILESGIESSVIFNHGCESAPLACYLKEQWDVPLVSAVHILDDLFDEAQGAFRPKRHDRYVRKALEADGFTRSDLIVAPNDYIASRLGEIHAGISDRIAVIPHPRSCDVPAKRSYQRGEVLRAICVGRLISYKGIGPLLDAVRMVSRHVDLRLTIVGDGPESARVQAESEEHGNIEWVSHLSHDKLIKTYEDFDIALFPSTLETHSMVLHEAMQAGLPVVAADVEPTRSLVADAAEAVLVPVDVTDAGVLVNPRALADAIVEFARDDPLREKIGRAGRRRSELLPRPYDYAERIDRIIGDSLHRGGDTAQG
jgi:glycosyltransferase involved in cell wall biosynthesis